MPATPRVQWKSTLKILSSRSVDTNHESRIRRVRLPERKRERTNKTLDSSHQAGPSKSSTRPSFGQVTRTTVRIPPIGFIKTPHSTDSLKKNKRASGSRITTSNAESPRRNGIQRPQETHQRINGSIHRIQFDEFTGS